MDIFIEKKIIITFGFLETLVYLCEVIKPKEQWKELS